MIRRNLSLLSLVIFFLVACGFLLPQPTFMVATPVISPSITPTTLVISEVSATSLTIMFEFNHPTNCREGPSIDFGILTHIPKGEIAEIMGRNKDSTWLNVSRNGIACWVSIVTGSINGEAVDATVSAVKLVPVVAEPALRKDPGLSVPSTLIATQGSIPGPPLPTSTHHFLPPQLPPPSFAPPALP